ncbi:hypothetical protein P692DRAFT_20751011, partial [Suillus brevipes Sb2]
GSLEEIGRLQYYISLLGRVRLGAEHPDYRTLVSLATQVLVGHILLSWEIVSGMSLAALADRKSTAEELKVFATKICHTYVSAHAVKDVSGQPDSEIQDRVLQNIILLNRDLLIFYKLDLAISLGDFGHVEIFLGTLTMMFAGAGCKNYTTELLHFIQNFFEQNKIWTSNFVNVVWDNVLINISGCDGHTVGVDKNCEQNINFQKVICISSVRQLITTLLFHTELVHSHFTSNLNDISQ